MATVLSRKAKMKRYPFLTLITLWPLAVGLMAARAWDLGLLLIMFNLLLTCCLSILFPDGGYYFWMRRASTYWPLIGSAVFFVGLSYLRLFGLAYFGGPQMWGSILTWTGFLLVLISIPRHLAVAAQSRQLEARHIRIEGASGGSNHAGRRLEN